MFVLGFADFALPVFLACKVVDEKTEQTSRVYCDNSVLEQCPSEDVYMRHSDGGGLVVFSTAVTVPFSGDTALATSRLIWANAR
jgi:hypothetical protein